MKEPSRPAITGAQIAAAVIALIAPIAEGLHAFGVYDLSTPQQDALKGLVVALAAFAGVLVAADAAIRAARNAAHAKVAAAAPKPAPQQPSVISTTSGDAVTAVAWNEPRPGVDVTNPVPTVTDDEPGDPDALPDYETTTTVPPDEGDQPS